MNDLYDQIRPADEDLDVATAQRVWVRISNLPADAPSAECHLTANGPDLSVDVLTLPIGDADARGRRRSRRTVATAAAAVAVIGLGGLWVVASSDESSAPIPAVQPVGSTVTPDARTSPAPTTVSTPVSSVPLCTDFGCGGFDPLPVAAGITDFYLGPASLGEPTVRDEWFGTLTRCVSLSADLRSCEKIEGIAGVSLVSYPLVTGDPGTIDPDSDTGIRIGTTFTDLDPSTYATIWGPTQRDGSRSNTTVRGHPAIGYVNETDPAVVWRERPGVLVWVAVPADRVGDLMSIAEDVRVTDGPPTIPNRVIVTDLAEPWDAQNNDGDGLIVGTWSGQECVGLDYVDMCGTDIGRRTIVRVHPDGTTDVAGSTNADTPTVRIAVTGNAPVEIDTIPFADYPGRYYSTTVPAGAVETITWLDSTGTELNRYTPQLTAPDVTGSVQVYTTADGDTLATIAQRFELSANDIAAANGWANVGPDDRLEPGTNVMIPPPAQPAG